MLRSTSRLWTSSGLAPRTVYKQTLPVFTQQNSYSTERSYGNLKDSDRIFTNLYGEHDIFIKGALKRVCKSIIMSFKYKYLSK